MVVSKISPHILAIDQGTTSSRAIVFNESNQVVSLAQKEFTQYFPEDGWVEHDPEEIWNSTLEVVISALKKAALDASEIAGIAITNQRETTLIWDRHTGKPVYKAIVWQDRRTAGYCNQLKDEGYEPTVCAKTGLLLDPYFSGTKIKWILDNVSGVRARAEKGDLAFGTVDTFLLWRLTGGKSHKTDATNASRTLLFNIHDQKWDEELLKKLDIPSALMPSVEDCASEFGETEKELLGKPVPVRGIAGDQQAALIGQCCFDKGMTKSTYGTGCFVIMNTGDQALVSQNKLLTTVGYRLDGAVTYGLEGSIFIAGAVVQWLRDGLKLIEQASDTEEIASNTQAAHGVYLVPAFTGLGAPYWDPDARGGILGLTRDTQVSDIVTAGLQAVCYQTRDLLEAMKKDGADPTVLRVDGGMVANNWLCQFLADMLRAGVDRPRVTETTALGAACLAGLQAGIFESLESLQKNWQQDRLFEPGLPAEEASRLYSGWLKAVDRIRSDR